MNVGANVTILIFILGAVWAFAYYEYETFKRTIPFAYFSIVLIFIGYILFDYLHDRILREILEKTHNEYQDYLTSDIKLVRYVNSEDVEAVFEKYKLNPLVSYLIFALLMSLLLFLSFLPDIFNNHPFNKRKNMGK